MLNNNESLETPVFQSSFFLLHTDLFISYCSRILSISICGIVNFSNFGISRLLSYRSKLPVIPDDRNGRDFHVRD